MTRSEIIEHIRAHHGSRTLAQMSSETSISAKAVRAVIGRGFRERRSHSQELIAAVCAAHGTSREAVAERFDLSPRAISSIWHRHLGPRKPRRIPPEIVTAVCAARWTVSAIGLARQFEMNPRAVESIWSRYRSLIPPRPERIAVRRPAPSCLAGLLGIHSVAGLHGISVPHVTILHGEARP